MKRYVAKYLKFALVAALLAIILVPFAGRQQTARAAITALAVTITPDTNIKGAASEYLISWDTDEAYALPIVVTINFPDNMVLPAAAVLLANLTSASDVDGVTAEGELLPTSATTVAVAAGNVVTITYDDDPASNIDLTDTGGFAINFDVDAGIRNPYVDGESDLITVDTNQVGEADLDPIESDDIVYALGSGIEPNPPTVGVVAQYTVQFISTAGLTHGSDTVTVIFPAGVVLPASITRDNITFDVDGPGGEDANPLTTVPLVTPSTRTVVVTLPLSLPNLEGAPDVAEDATVTIFFSQIAGITNPTVGGEAGTLALTTAGRISTSKQLVANVSNPVVYTRTLVHSPTNGVRGTTVTTTASGLTAGSGATLWEDANGSNTIDAGEVSLATGTVGTDNKVVFTWLANVPPLAAGANAGVLRVRDNSGLVNVSDTLGPVTPAATFTVNRSISLSPSTVTRGSSIRLTGQDFIAGDDIDGTDGDGDVAIDDGITIGGIACGSSTVAPATPGVTVEATATGTLPAGTFCVVPATVPLGTNTVRVFVNGLAASVATATATVSGAPVTLSPTSGVPGQPITITATGFSAGVVIPDGAITIGGADWVADAGEVAEATLDGSGNLPALTLNVPAAQEPGTYQVVITDALGLTGVATLIVPTRSITITPTSSLRNSVITINGTGFPRNSSIILNYGAPVIGASSARTDSNGAFSGTLTVPNGAGINSENAIVATEPVSGFSNLNSITHTVPGPTLTVTPSTIAVGGNLSVSGTGFPGFVGVTVLTIGTLGALPAGGINTNADGAFSATILVPNQNPGTTAVSVTAGGITASTPVTVTAAPVVPATQPTGTVFASVVSNADNLVRVWRYSNATQAWAFYDPRTAFAAANTLPTTTSGDIVWVNVKVNQTFQGETLFAGWNLISLD